MNVGGSRNPRLQGVRQTAGAPISPEGGPPRTVIAVVPVEYFAVAFNDENGRLQRMVVLRVGDKVHVPPGAVEWARTLKAGAAWLEEGINRMAGQRVEVPELDPNALPPDGVDVLGGEGEGQDKLEGDDAGPPSA